MLRLVDDALVHVNLEMYQKDKSARSSYLVDQVLIRFARAAMPNPADRRMFLDLAPQAAALERAKATLEQALSEGSELPNSVSYPGKFLQTADHLLAVMAGITRFERAVRSGSPSLRAWLYPSETPKVPSALSLRLQSLADPENDREKVAGYSDTTLAAKVIEMVTENSLARSHSVVYGTKTLLIYLPLMVDRLLNPKALPEPAKEMAEILEATQITLAHLERYSQLLQARRREASPETVGLSR